MTASRQNQLVSRRTGDIALIAAAIALVLLLSGCADDPEAGYTFNSPHPTDVSTVAVPVWTVSANVYRRGLEDRLAEALVKHIELITPYKVTNSSRADTELTGMIRNVEQRVLSFNPDTGRPRELEITITVSFVWKDLRTGKARASQDRLAVSGAYVQHEPIGQDFFQGSEDVINRLARKIVEELESEW